MRKTQDSTHQPVVAGKIQERAKRIRLLAMDVDGVLTGGEIIILNSGEEVKIWSVKDRMGFAILRRSQLPIKLAWITARKSLQVQKRAREIGIHFLFQKCEDKWKAIQRCIKKLGITAQEVAYIGDDLVDVPVLRRVGLAVCPPESPMEVKQFSHYQTKIAAGKGVVREVIEILIRSQGAWKKATAGLLLLLVGVVPLFFCGCSAMMEAPQELSEKPDQWVEKFTITETLAGLPVWILRSQSAEVYNKKMRVHLDQIQIQFMKTAPSLEKGLAKKSGKESLLAAKRAQKVAALLSAPKGEVEMDTRDLVAWGGVKVESEDGTKLLTERLRFSTSRQKILTEAAVKIVRANSVLLGEGLEASADLSDVKILRHQAEIHPVK